MAIQPVSDTEVTTEQRYTNLLLFIIITQQAIQPTELREPGEL